MKTIWELLKENLEPTKKLTIEEFKREIEARQTASHNGVKIATNPTRLFQKGIRSQLSITPDEDNTGIIYIGFDNSVSPSNYCQKLNPDDVFLADNLNAEVWCYSTVLNEIVYTGEW